MESPQEAPKSKAIILRRLAEFAERQGLSSNQAILIYAGNAGFLNLEHTSIAISVLQKLATQNGISLDDTEPFILQLIEKGVIKPEETEIFGWRTAHGTAKATEGQAEKVSSNGANAAIGSNGDRTESTRSRRGRPRASST